MKIGTVPGEYFFRGLVRPVATEDKTQHVWFPTPGYFSSKDEMLEDFPPNQFEARWPAEFQEEGVVYVPAEAELHQ